MTGPRRSAAARMKRYRARREAGLVVLPLKIDEIDTAAMLDRRRVARSGCDADDREQIAAALEQQIANLIRLARYA